MYIRIILYLVRHGTESDDGFTGVEGHELIFDFITSILGTDEMNFVEAVRYNGLSVNQINTVNDLLMTDDGTYRFQIHYLTPDEDSDDDDRVLPSPSTSGSSSDEEIWYTPPQAFQPVPPAEPDPFEVYAQLFTGTNQNYGLDEDEVY